MPATATPVVHIDDDRFRVTEWQFQPGAETGWHRHGHDYVIVPLCDGTLSLDLPKGQKAEAKLTQGVPYSRRVGVEHNVINGSNSQPLAFLEVEVVDDAAAHRRRDTMVAMMAGFNARDVDGVMACMSQDCAFHASAGPEAEGQRHIGRDAVRRATEAISVMLSAEVLVAITVSSPKRLSASRTMACLMSIFSVAVSITSAACLGASSSPLALCRRASAAAASS